MQINGTHIRTKVLRILCSLSLTLLVFTSAVLAQQDRVDSFKKALLQTNLPDSIRISSLNILATIDGRTNKSRADSLFREAMALAQRSNNHYGEIRALVGITRFQREKGSFAAAQESLARLFEVARKNSQFDFVSVAVNDMYRDCFMYPSGDYIKELEYALLYLKLSEHHGIQPLIADACTQTAIVFTSLGNYRLAMEYHKRALAILEQSPFRQSLIHANALLFLGETYRNFGYYTEAIEEYNQSFRIAKKQNAVVFAIENESNLANLYSKQKRFKEAFAIAYRTLAGYTHLQSDGGISYVSLILARAYLSINEPDSALVFGETCLQFALKVNDWDLISRSHDVLSKAYAIKNNFKAAYTHNLAHLQYEDSLFNKNKAYQVAYLQYSTEIALKESKIGLLEKDKLIRATEASRQRQWLYFMVAGVGLVLAIMVLLLRSYRTKQRANKLLEQQKQAIKASLLELKATQAQLIQREKMASLGELTAGIAHEIQNPLNFVNNFSETNVELLDELEQEAQTGNMAGVIEAVRDIRENEQKIVHHGKRADSIVKGMLQHSRASAGERLPTDINALVDEYLRLTYHGIRAKDKTFEVQLQTDFDKNIGKINVVLQDVGRVLLNLFNNAFYAVTEKKKITDGSYEPTVTVSTKKEDEKVIITVQDNGMGISKSAIDKIFQPFFTTKPTGEGTGLGLSLSYDIVKAHGGELKVESMEGRGAAFTISLPTHA